MLGKFLAIEGTDGSGKATQVAMLLKFLEKQSIPYENIAFPRYHDNPYGKLIGRYLKGEFGGINKVDYQLISLAFAGDRMLAKPLIEKWLKSGKMVIADRYVPSNKAHMGARLNPANRKKFITWLDDLEYKINQIPREDLVIFLNVTPSVAQLNVGIRGIAHDLHEKNLRHLKISNSIYHQLARKEKNWVIINCVSKGKMRTKEEIHLEILDILKKKQFI